MVRERIWNLGKRSRYRRKEPVAGPNFLVGPSFLDKHHSRKEFLLAARGEKIAGYQCNHCTQQHALNNFTSNGLRYALTAVRSLPFQLPTTEKLNGGTSLRSRRPKYYSPPRIPSFQIRRPCRQPCERIYYGSGKTGTTEIGSSEALACGVEVQTSDSPNVGDD
ncbi:hypothetical protein CIB48_g9443 [Xylaria polymorpha]|nr:hypothetical protein CIB48_g9443 [Xylaria polymorpha]